VFHRYARGGTFTVTLTVTEGDGTQASTTLQVPVWSLPTGERLPSLAGPSAKSRKDPRYARVASKVAGTARSVFCWNTVDWSILQKAFDESAIGGYVDPAKPKQIALAPNVCSRLDGLEYRKPPAVPTTKTAAAILVFGREIEESEGRVNAAQATCYALQQVPATSELLGASPAPARKLGRLAATWYRRPNLPFGAWSAQCHDGGKLDLDRRHQHWP
jgi:hypothetical protein